MRRIIAALACALVFAACSREGAEGGGGRRAWTVPGELRVGIQRDPNTLNPILAANTTESFVNRLSFDTLTAASADGKSLVPILAETVPDPKNGGISPDGLTITYRLRSGVKWQDGAAFTSRDVAFTWRAIMSDANNVNTRVGYQDVARVETPNDTTVVFHLKHRFAPFVGTVFSDSDDPYCVLPEHLLAKYPDLNRIPFNTAPVGTGPYRVTRWVRGDHIELVANDTYFRGAPKLKRITVRTIPDENTEINALRSHAIDWMFEPSPTTYPVIKSIPDVKIVLGDSPQTLKMQFNNSRPPFNDVRVRRAIAYAIDKPGLVQRFTGGSATVATEDQPRYSWAYSRDVTVYPYDPARATALLRDAGWRPGANGILTKNGQPLAVQLSYNVENATRRLVSVQVQSQLKAIGVDSEIKTYPANLFFATYGQGGILTNAKFDAAISGWVAGIDPDDHSLFGCDQFPPKGTNYDRYCSAAMDAAQRAALGTYDQDQRAKAYARIQKILSDDVPEIYLWYARFPQAINPDFKGFAPNPVNEAWNAYQWEI